MATEITDWFGFQDYRDNQSGDYNLAADLDSTTNGYDEIAGPNANSGDGFQTLESDQYNGVFEGNGHTISDIVVDNTASTDVIQTIFGRLGGELRNVQFDNITINAAERTAVLDGIDDGATLINVAFTRLDLEANTFAAPINSASISNTAPTADHVYSVENQYHVRGNDGATATASGLFVQDTEGNSSQNLNPTEVTEAYVAEQTFTTNKASFDNLDPVVAIPDTRDDNEPSPTYNSVYFDSETVAPDTSKVAATPLTTSEMIGTEAETNLSGFDFTNTWDRIASADNDSLSDGYAILQSVDTTNQRNAQAINTNLGTRPRGRRGAPVDSVNGKVGAVELGAGEVGAASDPHGNENHSAAFLDDSDVTLTSVAGGYELTINGQTIQFNE